MELRHIRYFTAVADHLHFGNAARQLRVAQPALSVQIRQLEAILGGDLFHRNKQSVTLTEAGRLFRVEARKILDQTTHAEAVAKSAFKGLNATLNIGYSGSAAASGGLRRLIDAIRRSSATIEIVLHEMDPLDQLKQLLARKIHFGFPITNLFLQHVDVFSMRLESWPLVLALPIGHPLTNKKKISIADLQNEGFVVCANDDQGGIFPPNSKVSQRVRSDTMVIPMVAVGMGVALVPASLREMYVGDKVVFRPITDFTEELECSIIFMRKQHEPSVQRVLAMIAVNFGCTYPGSEESKIAG